VNQETRGAVVRKSPGWFRDSFNFPGPTRYYKSATNVPKKCIVCDDYPRPTPALKPRRPAGCPITSRIHSMPHLSGELFKRMAGIEMTHVPYRGAEALMVNN
jgi:hypothetical protein